jgi:Uma2 family endonuclease
MSWEEYWALPDELRAEYSDGRAFVSAAPVYRHQKVSMRLAAVLQRDLPDLEVVVGAGWRMVDQPPRLRIPDVAVLRAAPVGDVITEPPLVVIEVLSSNRTDDLVRKATEYLDAGAGQYWIVDPRDNVIDCYRREGRGWVSALRLEDSDPAGSVDVDPVGRVTMSVEEILAS